MYSDVHTHSPVCILYGGITKWAFKYLYGSQCNTPSVWSVPITPPSTMRPSPSPTAVTSLNPSIQPVPATPGPTPVVTKAPETVNPSMTPEPDTVAPSSRSPVQGTSACRLHSIDSCEYLVGSCRGEEADIPLCSYTSEARLDGPYHLGRSRQSFKHEVYVQMAEYSGCAAACTSYRLSVLHRASCTSRNKTHPATKMNRMLAMWSYTPLRSVCFLAIFIALSGFIAPVRDVVRKEYLYRPRRVPRSIERGLNMTPRLHGAPPNNRCQCQHHRKQ